MLRTSLISSTILAAMFAGGVAFADETFGTIKSVDDAAKTVTLGDGIVYQLNDKSMSYEIAGGYPLPGYGLTRPVDHVHVRIIARQRHGLYPGVQILQPRVSDADHGHNLREIGSDAFFVLDLHAQILSVIAPPLWH